MAVPAAGFGGFVGVAGFVDGIFLLASFSGAGGIARFGLGAGARERGEVVVSGFHSSLERDALEILLSGGSPVVMAVARGLPSRFRPDVRRGLESGVLTLASPFPGEVGRQTAETAAVRNDFIFSLSTRVVIGWAAPDGGLSRLLSAQKDGKEIRRLCPK